MNSKNTNANKSPQFKDVSRYTRWVNWLDEKDNGLSTRKRKTKWMFLLGILILIFILSFIFFPSSEFSHENLEPPTSGIEAEIHADPSQPTFEMPVDSFENLLKKNINENLSKKE